MRALALLAVLGGCGFRAVAAGDLGAVDLGPADLAAGDGMSAPDQDAATDLALGATGPGPLGALPTGYCCNSDYDCRGRSCGGAGLGVNSACLDVCYDDRICTAYSSSFGCNVQISLCEPTGSYTCTPAADYQLGHKPSGACCTPSTGQSGQECLGGLCVRTGDLSNPYYCSQGCEGNESCPSGFTCALQANGAPFDYRQCWLNPTVAQSDGHYQCQP